MHENAGKIYLQTAAGSNVPNPHLHSPDILFIVLYKYLCTHICEVTCGINKSVLVILYKISFSFLRIILKIWSL